MTPPLQQRRHGDHLRSACVQVFALLVLIYSGSNPASANGAEFDADLLFPDSCVAAFSPNQMISQASFRETTQQTEWRPTSSARQQGWRAATEQTPFQFVNHTDDFRPLAEELPTLESPEIVQPAAQPVGYYQPVPATPYYTMPVPPDLAYSQFGQGLSLGEFFWNDLGVTVGNLDDDFLNFWEPRNVLFLGTGLGISLALRDEVDGDTRAYVATHPKRWGKGTETLGILGNAEVQIGGILLLYSYGFSQQDQELLDFSRLLIRTYTMTGLATVAIKGIANTDRPSKQWNDGKFGFPSSHVSSSFAIAATIEEFYGPQMGIPAYILATLIGFSRIDEQDHDVSDVVFGAFLGYAIAKSISGEELRHDSRIQFAPWINPNDGSLGGMFELRY